MSDVKAWRAAGLPVPPIPGASAPAIPPALSLAKEKDTEGDSRTEGDFSPWLVGQRGLKLDTALLWYAAAPYDAALAPAEQVYWWEGDGDRYAPGWYSSYVLDTIGIPFTTRLSLTKALGV